ncbi:MAG: chromosomal replication initiator protein DnaA [Kiritimatiellae bacterium]|nr:chromosomal replication initiator protein DnaA [Kiritimatiellia bacterium]
MPLTDQFTAETLWQNILDYLTSQLSELTVMTHIGTKSKGVALTDDTLTVELYEDKDENELQQKFGFFIRAGLTSLSAPPQMKVVFRTKQPEKVAPIPSAPVQQTAPANDGSETLDPSMTFDFFVQGPNNTFPLTMARYVATNTANRAESKINEDLNRTNPLFLHGPTGVGKTHLMHAIGNLAKKLNPSLVVRYTTTENLLNEYVKSWTNDVTQEAFRQKFRTVDILLVDDIQFMAKREGLQKEFFNIFNALKDNHRQIVMTSDRAPKDVPDLMDRLVSRFESGLCADVDMPAYETRLNILKMKLRATPEVALSDSVLDFIAQKVTSSVRALEGALSSTVNYARMFPGNKEAVTVEVLEKSILKNFIAEEDSIIKLSCNDIQKAVCSYYNISIQDINSKSREQHIAIARQVAIFLCRKLTDCSATELGHVFNRTHATVLYACNTVYALFKENDSKTVIALKTIASKLGRTISDLS